MVKYPFKSVVKRMRMQSNELNLVFTYLEGYIFGLQSEIRRLQKKCGEPIRDFTGEPIDLGAALE